MFIVDFYDFSGNHESGKLVLTVKLEEGKVVFSDDSGFVDRLKKGVLFGKKTFKPSDGEDFIKVLPKVFSGSFFVAVPRENKKTSSVRSF